MATTTPNPSSIVESPPRKTTYEGQVVYVYAFDIAYEMRRYDKPDLMGQPVAQFKVDPSRRNPRQLFFHRPLMVRMPPLEKFGPDGVVRLEWTVKFLQVGAISLTLRLPFKVESLRELTALHDVRFSDGRSIHDEARDLAEQVRQALLPYLINPRPTPSDEEAYTVFCVRTPDAAPDAAEFDADPWLIANRRRVAALLTEEFESGDLSDGEVRESTSVNLSYSRRDMVVLDWDAALVIDEPDQFEQTLYVIELANLQLTELEAYDRFLDEAVDRAYADLATTGWRKWFGHKAQRELRVLRIDMARLTDELGNFSKFFGDWHAARVYQAISTRFHLGDWQKTINTKLQTLDQMYTLMSGDRTNRWMVMLEAMIVLLIFLPMVPPIVKWLTGSN